MTEEELRAAGAAYPENVNRVLLTSGQIARALEKLLSLERNSLVTNVRANADSISIVFVDSITGESGWHPLTFPVAEMLSPLDAFVKNILTAYAKGKAGT